MMIKLSPKKKPEVREKPVLLTFSNQNTTKTGRESKLGKLILMVIKLSPTKNRKSEKKRFSVFLKIKSPQKPACKVSWLCWIYWLQNKVWFKTEKPTKIDNRFTEIWPYSSKNDQKLPNSVILIEYSQVIAHLAENELRITTKITIFYRNMTLFIGNWPKMTKFHKFKDSQVKPHLAGNRRKIELM